MSTNSANRIAPVISGYWTFPVHAGQRTGSVSGGPKIVLANGDTSIINQAVNPPPTVEKVESLYLKNLGAEISNILQENSLTVVDYCTTGQDMVDFLCKTLQNMVDEYRKAKDSINKDHALKSALNNSQCTESLRILAKTLGTTINFSLFKEIISANLKDPFEALHIFSINAQESQCKEEFKKKFKCSPEEILGAILSEKDFLKESTIDNIGQHEIIRLLASLIVNAKSVLRFTRKDDENLQNFLAAVHLIFNDLTQAGFKNNNDVPAQLLDSTISSFDCQLNKMFQTIKNICSLPRGDRSEGDHHTFILRSIQDFIDNETKSFPLDKLPIGCGRFLFIELLLKDLNSDPNFIIKSK